MNDVTIGQETSNTDETLESRLRQFDEIKRTSPLEAYEGAAMLMDEARRAGDVASVAEASLVCAVTATMLWRLSDALAHSHVACSSFWSVGDCEGVIRARMQEAHVNARLGDYSRAIATMRSVQTWAEENGDSRSELGSVGFLSWCYREIGQFEMAAENAERAAAIAERSGEDDDFIQAFAQAAEASIERGKLDTALQFAHAAVDRCGPETPPIFRATALGVLSRAHIESGDWDAADRCAHDSLTEASKIECAGLELEAHLLLAMSGFERDPSPATCARLEEVVNEVVESDKSTTTGEGLITLARAKARLGDWQGAAETWERHFEFRKLIDGERNRLLLDAAAALSEARAEQEERQNLEAELGRMMDRQSELRSQAERDPLTGLLHRRGALGWIDRHWPHLESVSLMVIDIDRFKDFNDRFGHAVGDEVLRRVGQRLEDLVRSEDLVVRWGGEEFVVVSTKVGGDLSRDLAERLRRGVADLTIDADSTPAGVTITVGAAIREEGEGFDSLCKRADLALYEGKRSGRDRVVLAG